MAKFLANENVPGEVVEAARQVTLEVLRQIATWEGNFPVAQEGKLRVVSLP